MSTKTRQETVIELVRQAKSGQFGLTAIKVEFEAKFGRSNRVVYPSCANCVESRIDHAECDGGGCDDCDWNGSTPCPVCTRRGINWGDFNYVHDQILKKLVRSGLARRMKPSERSEFSYKYLPVYPIVFSRALPDGTVDTEQTLTLLMDKPENVLHLPRLAKAFAGLANDIGKGMDVSNAGIHISLLNSDGGFYRTRPTQSDLTYYANFKRSMVLLMPALFFLASASGKTRKMFYRRPMIATDGEDIGGESGKYSAISYRGGALEFRVFDTCYDQPEQILDDVVVALNCLRFWTPKYTRNHLQKVANNVRFGIDGSDELKRLYVTNEHIDLLNRGLRIIKPPYLSVTEIKRQRNFTITKNETKDFMKNVKLKAEAEYKIYEKRIGWESVMRRNNYINDRIQQMIGEASPNHPQHEGVTLDLPAIGEEKMKEFTDNAEAEAKAYLDRHKESFDYYSREAIPRIGQTGGYILCAE